MFNANDKTNAPKEPVMKKRAESKTSPPPPARGKFSRSFTPSSAKKGRATEYTKQVKEFLEENNDTETIIIMPDNDLARDLSDSYGFVIHANRVDADLMWHLLVFESSITPVAMEEVKDRSRRGTREEKIFNFESTSDAITDELVKDFEDWILNTVEVSGQLYFTNATVVPVEVDLSAAETVQMLACDAEDSNILIANVDEPFSAEMLAQNSSLRAKLTFTPNEEAVTLGGMPLRSDLQIAISETFREKNVSQIRASSGSRTLLEIDAFVNARWVGNELPDRDQDFDPATYIPEVVMTQSNPYHQDVTSGNFERFFLGLAAMMFLKDNDLWMKQFESNMHNSHAKLSGLAYGMFWPNNEIPSDINLVDEDPTESANWLRKVLYRTERSRNIPVEFAVLINESTLGYATQKLLLDVADGDLTAVDKLVKVLSNLTDGVSDDVMIVQRSSDVISGQIRVPVGYYTTADGNRPIEEIDTLHIMNTLKDNYPEKLDDYFEIVQIDDREFNHEESMSKMIAILNLVTDGQFKLKGFGTKLYINPEFLQGLAESVKHGDSGLGMELDSNVELSNRGGRRNTGRRTTAGLSTSPLGNQRRRHSSNRNVGLSSRYR